MPGSSTQVLKCVFFAEEPMYNVGKDDNSLSDFVLNIQVKNIGANGICESGDSTVISRNDSSADHKKMVAITPADVGGSFSGKCVYARTIPEAALETTTVTTLTMCYHAAVNDDV